MLSTFKSSMLEEAIDLSIAQLSVPGAGQLVVTTRATTVRTVLAAVFGLVCLGFVIDVWLNRHDLWDVIWPHVIVIPVFGTIAIVFGFGHQQKAFDATRRTLNIDARLGPLQWHQQQSVPMRTSVKLTFHKITSTSPHSSAPVTWYDINVEGVPAAGFTIAGDREAARTFARTLADTLQCSVIDEVEDDGIQRIPPRGRKQ
jgi:hypothetical protein